ncbi:MAG: chorismate mutase [bacterium]|nr:chorismate mutase [bacterium]
MSKQAKDLTTLRRQIFTADSAVLSSLAKRIRVVEKIGAYKGAHDIKPFDAKLRAKRRDEWVARGTHLGLSKKFVTDIYNIVHDYSVSVEKKIGKL